jgi:hypothetical protein
MAIYRLLKFAAFDPEDVSCMTTAYEDALHVLKLADRQDPITELVAKKIIDVSQQGERDPVRLRERALRELETKALLPLPLAFLRSAVGTHCGEATRGATATP